MPLFSFLESISNIIYMLLIYIGIYTLSLVAIWALFMIARIHAYKFKNFSLMIVKVTNILGIILLALSLLWYVFIFFNTE